MKRPSKEVSERYRKHFGPNLENLLLDFELVVTQEMESNQALLNILFATFVSGMATAMDPSSNFNSKYKMENTCDNTTTS